MSTDAAVWPYVWARILRPLINGLLMMVLLPVFSLIVTPAAIAARIFANPMGLRPEPKLHTYRRIHRDSSHEHDQDTC